VSELVEAVQAVDAALLEAFGGSEDVVWAAWHTVRAAAFRGEQLRLAMDNAVEVVTSGGGQEGAK
jgi:hypothetical protein